MVKINGLNKYVPESIKSSLFIKYGILFFVFGICLIIIGVGSSFLIIGEIEELALSQNEEQVNNIGQTVEQWDQSNEQAFRIMLNGNAFQINDEEEIASQLRRGLPGEAVAFGVYDDEQEEFIIREGRDEFTLDAIPQGEEFIDSISGGEMIRSSPHKVTQSDIIEDEVVSYGSQASSFSGNKFIAMYPTDNMIDSTQDGEITLVIDNETREIITATENEQELFGSEFATQQYFEELEEESIIVNEVPIDQYDSMEEEHIRSTSETERYTVISYKETDEVFGFVNLIQYGMILIVFVFSGAITVTGAVFGRRISKNMESLQMTAQQIADGDLETSFDSTRTDSIGKVYESLDTMRNDLLNNLEKANKLKQQAEQSQEEAKKAEKRAKEEKNRMDSFNNSLQEDITVIEEVLNNLKQKELWGRVDVSEIETSEMEEIARSLNNSLDNIEDTVKDVDEFTDEVLSNTEILVEKNHSFSEEGDYIRSNVSEIDVKSETQQDKINNISKSTQQLAVKSEEAAASTEEVLSTTEETKDKIVDSKRSITAIKQEAEGMDENMKQTSEEIDQLISYVNTIEELLDNITEISEEINILALNANIEAAKAGQGTAGGFSVVANEVKELSEQTNDVVEEMEDQLQEIRHKSDSVEKKVEKTESSVENVRNQIEGMTDQMEEITNSADITYESVEEIKENSELQVESIQEIVQLITEIKSISEEFTQQSSEVSEIIKDQSEEYEEGAQIAEDLQKKAKTLETKIQEFSYSDE